MCDLLIGKTKEQVLNAFKDNKSYFCVIIREDGINYATTCDLRNDRIFLEVEKGVVVEANIG